MKKILFVCTGNTCRSPMAQDVFNSKVKKMGICAVAESAGIFADGSAMSGYARLALKEYGIEPSEHVSRTITADIAKEFDYIIGMTVSHAEKLISAYPELKDRIYAFPIDISDPFCGNLAVYTKTLKEINSGTDIIINKLFGK